MYGSLPQYSTQSQHRPTTHTHTHTHYIAVITLCTTAIDTGVAWVELAIVMSVNSSIAAGTRSSITSELNPLWLIMVAIAQTALVFTVGRWILVRIGKHVHKKGQIEAIYLWFTVFLMFGTAWLSEEIGISGMLGAFELGLMVPKNGTFNVGLKNRLEGTLIPLSHALSLFVSYTQQLEIIVSIMLPVYFTLSGLKTDFTQLTEYYYWLYMLLFSVAATAAKLPSVMIPAKIFGMSWFDSLSFGVRHNSLSLSLSLSLSFSLSFSVKLIYHFFFFFLFFFLRSL